MHPQEYEKLIDNAGARCGAPIKAAPQSKALELRRAIQSPRAPPAEDDDILLTSAQARARVGGVSTMCIWRWMRDTRVMFPVPVKINSRNYWRLGDLRRWQTERTTKVAA